MEWVSPEALVLWAATYADAAPGRRPSLSLVRSDDAAAAVETTAPASLLANSFELAQGDATP